MNASQRTVIARPTRLPRTPKINLRPNHAQIESTDESLRALGLRARDLYESLAVALADTTGIDIGLWREGIASLAFEEAEAELLRDAVAHQDRKSTRLNSSH